MNAVVICKDPSNLNTELGFELVKDQPYEVLGEKVIEGQKHYLIHRNMYFRWYYLASRFSLPLKIQNDANC